MIEETRRDLGADQAELQQKVSAVADNFAIWLLRLRFLVSKRGLHGPHRVLTTVSVFGRIAAEQEGDTHRLGKVCSTAHAVCLTCASASNWYPPNLSGCRLSGGTLSKLSERV